MKIRNIFYTLPIICLLALSACQITDTHQDAKYWTGVYSFEESMKSVRPQSPDWQWGYSLEVNPKSDQSYTAALEVRGYKTTLSFDCVALPIGDSLQIIFQSCPPDAEQIQYNKGDILLTLFKKEGRLLTYWRGIQPNVEENLAQGSTYFKILQASK